MPTYDYQCRSCGHVIEVIHAMTDDGPSVCERCGGSLRRVLYPAGIIFKGSGFYSTDSRGSTSASSDAPSSRADTSKADASKTTASSDSGSSAKGSTTSGTAKGGESAA